jgi:hypothetical protein
MTDEGFSADGRQVQDEAHVDDGDAVGEDAAGRWRWRVWGATGSEVDAGLEAACGEEGDVDD